jgi:hypothetical protein
MSEWPECWTDPDEVLPDDDPWMIWALKLTRSVPDASAAYATAQSVAKALRAVYWRGQGESGER